MSAYRFYPVGTRNYHLQYFEHSNAEVQKTSGKVARLTMSMEINFMIIDMWFLRAMMI